MNRAMETKMNDVSFSEEEHAAIRSARIHTRDPLAPEERNIVESMRARAHGKSAQPELRDLRALLAILDRHAPEPEMDEPLRAAGALRVDRGVDPERYARLRAMVMGL
jgi:hypothetical protein